MTQNAMTIKENRHKAAIISASGRGNGMISFENTPKILCACRADNRLVNPWVDAMPMGAAAPRSASAGRHR
jgi:hypothetical protein